MLQKIRDFLLPKTLFGRLILLPSSAIFFGFLLITIVVGYNQYIYVKNEIHHDSKVILKELSASIEKYLLLDDYAEIESVMRRFCLLESVKSISLINPEFNTLIKIDKDETKYLHVIINPNTKYQDIKNQFAVFIQEDVHAYISFYPIGERTQQHWIRLEISKDVLYAKLIDLLLFANAIAVALIVLLSILIYKIINRPLQDIATSTEFSLKLDMNIGSYCRVDSSIEEISNLVNSLNQLSQKLLKNQNVMNEQNQELQRFNHELTSRVEEEVQKNREKDITILNNARLVALAEMIGNIAHQWRQPLNAIALLIQSVQISYEIETLTPEEFDEFVKDSLMQVNYLSQTIDDFRDLIKEDKIHESFNVSEVIHKTFKLVEPSLKNSAINTSLDIEENIIASRSNANALSQAFINILNNAKDVLLQKHPNDKISNNKFIKIQLKQIDGKAKITICDNGGGIPQEIIAKIFDPYFTTKHQSNGTGLGLYISKKIIDNEMGGILHVQNTVDGACFSIEFESQKSN